MSFRDEDGGETDLGFRQVIELSISAKTAYNSNNFTGQFMQLVLRKERRGLSGETVQVIPPISQ